MENEITIFLEDVQGQQNGGYFISEEAIFPILTPSCIIENLQPRDKIQRMWAALSLNYTKNGRTDLWNVEVELLKQIQSQIIPINVPDVRGGLLSVQCFATIKDSAGRIITIKSNVVSWSIGAKQPIKKRVREMLQPNYLHAVVFKKTAFEQFLSTGDPVFNNGFGLYQITNPTVAQIWNWKQNVATANDDFEIRKKTARSLPEKMRLENPDLYKKLPNFKTSQIEMQAIQSYGIGNYYKPKKNILGSWSWEKDTTNDGYADSCILLLKEVSSGTLPAGWN